MKIAYGTRGTRVIAMTAIPGSILVIDQGYAGIFKASAKMVALI